MSARPTLVCSLKRVKKATPHAYAVMCVSTVQPTRAIEAATFGINLRFELTDGMCKGGLVHALDSSRASSRKPLVLTSRTSSHGPGALRSSPAFDTTDPR